MEKENKRTKKQRSKERSPEDTNKNGTKDITLKNISRKDVHAEDKNESVKEKNTKIKQPSHSPLKDPSKHQDFEETNKDEDKDKDETQKNELSHDKFIPTPRRPNRSPARARPIDDQDETNLSDTLVADPDKSEDPVANLNEAAKSMKYSNVVSGLSAAIALVADVAVNGTEKLTEERVKKPVQFLRTVVNENGENPPNIRKFLEHIELKTEKPNPKGVFSAK